MTHQNTPYVKIYNEKGILTNPITKHKPYVSSRKTEKQGAIICKGVHLLESKWLYFQPILDIKNVNNLSLITLSAQLKSSLITI